VNGANWRKFGVTLPSGAGAVLYFTYPAWYNHSAGGLSDALHASADTPRPFSDCESVREHVNEGGDVAPIVKELQAAGARSLPAIAAGLNARGVPTPSGIGEWKAETVAQLLAWLPELSSHRLRAVGE
jgi:hypothetical protein